VNLQPSVELKDWLDDLLKKEAAARSSKIVRSKAQAALGVL